VIGSQVYILLRKENLARVNSTGLVYELDSQNGEAYDGAAKEFLNPFTVWRLGYES
jgi:hypothetical protein